MHPSPNLIALLDACREARSLIRSQADMFASSLSRDDRSHDEARPYRLKLLAVLEALDACGHITTDRTTGLPGDQG